MQLSQFFQRTQIDLKYAKDQLNDTVAILNRRRSNADQVFETIYEEACTLAQELDVEIKMPRLSAKQTLWDNYSTVNPISYFKQSNINTSTWQFACRFKGLFS